MANVKISGLPAASTPLTGAELVPIVQSGVTSQTTVGAFNYFKQNGTGAVATTVQAKLRETVSVKDFGAVGNGSVSDTTAINNAITATGAQGDASAQVSFPTGNYQIAETSSSGVVLANDIALDGAGGKLTSVGMGYPVVYSSGKENLRIENMKIVGTGHSGNDPGSAGIRLEQFNTDGYNYSVLNNSLVDTSWGALLTAETGTGYAHNIRYVANDVRSTTAGTMADGLHVVGKIKNAVVASNTIMNRADAGIAMNMTLAANGYGFAITGNASTNNLVGVDVSGGRYGVVSGNSCYNTIDHAASNPAIRVIEYSGINPYHVVVTGNLALGTHTTSGEYDVKVDAQGLDTYATINSNQLNSFYTNAKHVYFSSNSFVGNGKITVDNYADQVFIGPNSWSNGMDIFGAGNAGLSGQVFLAKQQWTKWYAPNFLPNYSSANPFWDSKWFLDSDARLITSTSFSTSSGSYVDVTNGTFVLSSPIILDKIIALADCATHPGYLSITDMSNNIVATVNFSVTPGSGGTNVVASGFTYPTVAGNGYKPKLAAGTYKFRAYSALNALTIKTISIATWG